MIANLVLSTIHTSGITDPLTTLSPSPQLPSSVSLVMSAVVGSAVNMTPAARAFTIRSTHTPMGSRSSGQPLAGAARPENGC